jgi:Tfp pilus assembly protein PilX
MMAIGSTVRPRRPFRPGAALITALTAVMFLLIVGSGMLAMTSSSLQIAGRERDRLMAFNLAETAADRGARWLKDQGSPPSGTSALDPFSGNVSFGEGTYSATITPDANNSGATLKRFTVRGTGTVRGRTVQVESVVRQTSFGKYAYFTDKEVSSISGGTIWFVKRDRIRGPAHSNNSNDGSGNPTTFHINYQDPTNTYPGAIFQDMVTAAGSSITYDPSSPATEADFLKVYLSGSRGYHLGVDNIPLPTSTSAQQTAGWGSSDVTTVPTASTGAYVGQNVSDGGAMNGGIYIVGNCSMVAQLDGSGNQQFVVTQGSTVTTFTFDLANNQTIRQVGGTTQHLAGLGTGVLYCTGNITSLSGEIADNRYVQGSDPHITTRNAYTIATDVNNGKSVTLTNSITYHTQPDATQSSTALANLKAGTLGLFARNVIVDSNAPTAMTINAVMLAGSNSVSDGSFYVSNYSTKTPTGTLHLLGGVIQKARGPVGTFNSSTGTISTGYAKDYYYDPRLADSPPPYFPTTGGYDRLSWTRLAN